MNKNLILLLTIFIIAGCITASVERVRQGTTGITEGEGVVIMAKSYHLGNETESSFVKCLGKNVDRDGIRVIPSEEFIDGLFPWFEPRTAPADTKALPDLMKKPKVSEFIRANNIRYIIWVDGDTDKIDGGGSLSCAIGPGGGGCFGFAWWQKDGDYEASVWDLNGLEDVGKVSTSVKGTSFMPALIIPVPLIARTQTKACKGLAEQLTLFIIGEEENDL
jgi:hypothetical protein